MPDRQAARWDHLRHRSRSCSRPNDPGCRHPGPHPLGGCRHPTRPRDLAHLPAAPPSHCCGGMRLTPCKLASAPSTSGSGTGPTPSAGRTTIRCFGRTITGRRRRNEDAFLLAPELGVFAVLDGMGGYAGGDVASTIGAETIANFYAAIAADPEATWPYAVDLHRSLAQNR